MKNERPKGIVRGYTRVSTEDQADHGVSLMAQEMRLKDYYEKTLKPLGYEGFCIYRDEGVSAYKIPFINREKASLLMRDIGPGDMVLATTLDRVFRNTIDGAVTVKLIGERGADFTILDYGGQKIDTRDPMGKLVFNVMLSLGEMESDIKAARMASLFTHFKKVRGWTTHPPAGYIRSSRHPVLGRCVVPDVEFIQQARNLVDYVWSRPPKNWQQSAAEYVATPEYQQVMNTPRFKRTKTFGKALKGKDVRYFRGKLDVRCVEAHWARAVAALVNTGLIDEVAARHKIDPATVYDRETNTVFTPVGVRRKRQLTTPRGVNVERLQAAR